MAGIGNELRLEREGRGVSLEALSAETKVQTRHFSALEQNAYEELPGGVFRRGILRAYLKALDLEEEDWMPRFEASVEEDARLRGVTLEPSQEAWVTFAENVQRSRPGSSRHFDWRWVGVAFLLLFVGLGGWVLWTFELRALLVR